MIRDPDPNPPDVVMKAHLVRQAGSTKFRRHRAGSVAASLPSLGAEPDNEVRITLSPETWRKMGCPEHLAVTFEPSQVVASLGEPLTAPGGVCAPSSVPWGS